jgi:outer membrane immunogenic protein
MMSGAIQLAAGAETGAALPKKAPRPSPVFSWTGFYLGGNVGGGTSHINFSGTGVFTIAGVADPFAFANSGTASGILAGGQLGFNMNCPRTLSWVSRPILTDRPSTD